MTSDRRPMAAEVADDAAGATGVVLDLKPPP
jgi:hypothetical protein